MRVISLSLIVLLGLSAAFAASGKGGQGQRFDSPNRVEEGRGTGTPEDSNRP